MANMRILILVTMAVLGGSAFADDKPEPAAERAPPAAAAETADTKGAQDAKPAEKKPEFKPPAGYKVKIHGWDIVYCRKTPVLGSRFPKEICMTEAELREHLAANDEMRRNKDQSSRVCAGSACN
jgi:hypothetical protein